MKIETKFEIEEIIYYVYKHKEKEYSINKEIINGIRCIQGSSYFVNPDGTKNFPIIISYRLKGKDKYIYETENSLYKTKEEALERIKYLKEYDDKMSKYGKENKI